MPWACSTTALSSIQLNSQNSVGVISRTYICSKSAHVFAYQYTVKSCIERTAEEIPVQVRSTSKQNLTWTRFQKGDCRRYFSSIGSNRHPLLTRPCSRPLLPLRYSIDIRPHRSTVFQYSRVLISVPCYCSLQGSTVILSVQTPMSGSIKPQISWNQMCTEIEL